MTTIDRGRGRGAGGPRGGGGGAGGAGGGGRGGADGAPRRGAWRGGPPPGSAGSFPSRGASPAIGNPAAGPRTSINDHMSDMKKIVLDDKTRVGKGFQTDTDISRSSGPAPAERELKPWVGDIIPPESPALAGSPRLPPASRTNGASAGVGAGRDSETFGSATVNIPWDQFEANERLFGAKTNFQEEIYTTKLNRNGADFKKREKEAERLANEIMGQTAKNSHVAEERGQVPDGTVKDEEEKYSGVVRAPNAYVPPAARKAAGMGGVNPRTPAPASAVTTPAANANGSGAGTPALLAPKPVSPSPAPAPAPATNMAVPTPPARSASEDPTAKGVPAPGSAKDAAAEKTSSTPAPPAPAPLIVEHKDGQLGGVVDQWRQFVGVEREKVEAKKQSIYKSERERMLAEFKKFHTDFKVPLPIPKDILPILSKDAEKQKDIEAKATSGLEKAREAKKAQAQAQAASIKSPLKASAPMEAAKSDVPAPKIVAPKKIAMKIAEIPPFNAAKKKAPAIPVPESAAQNIPLATSPTPSTATSQAEGSLAKLNPGASSFVFKPNPSAVAFKPGQPSGSPAQAPRQPAAPAPTAAAGPSAAPKNPFFHNKVPERIMAVNTHQDFNPWKQGPVPSASSIGLQWPYTGRKHHSPSYSVSGPGVPIPGMPVHMNFEDDGTSPRAAPPPVMQMGPNYQQFGYRFHQPVPPHGIPGQLQTPMFSPGPQYSPLPGQQIQHVPQHLGPGPGPQPNGMPIYFQNGIPQNPAFIPPQHMQFNPHQHTPQRHGPGPGPGQGGPGGPGMYYPNPNHIGTPHQTPQLVQHNLPFQGQQPQQPQFQPQSHTQQQGPPNGNGAPGQ